MTFEDDFRKFVDEMIDKYGNIGISNSRDVVDSIIMQIDDRYIYKRKVSDFIDNWCWQIDDTYENMKLFEKEREELGL